MMEEKVVVSLNWYTFVVKIRNFFITSVVGINPYYTLKKDLVKLKSILRIIFCLERDRFNHLREKLTQTTIV